MPPLQPVEFPPPETGEGATSGTRGMIDERKTAEEGNMTTMRSAFAEAHPMAHKLELDMLFASR